MLEILEQSSIWDQEVNEEFKEKSAEFVKFLEAEGDSDSDDEDDDDDEDSDDD